MSLTFESVRTILLQVIAIFLVIVLHEVAHGYVAHRLGDPTAKQQGRLTLNPLAHIDPVGTILVPLALIILGLPAFGWARPVPVNPRYFRNPLRGMMIVALAGPMTNFVLAGLGIGIVRLLVNNVPLPLLIESTAAALVVQSILLFAVMFAVYNVVIGIYNLIPVPPLDGSRVLLYFLPPRAKEFWIGLERYGLILIVLVFLLIGRVSPLGSALNTLINWMLTPA
ncbi:site-2 protease family protein [Candidatus Bipolaricaulota bacterium]|nr:site-2 protease family protein [Candidatus Bipolaricaulota bacterium]